MKQFVSPRSAALSTAAAASIAKITRRCNFSVRKRSLLAVIGVSLAVSLCLAFSHVYEFMNVRTNCTGYFELRSVNFLHDNTRSRLCDNATAYTIVKGRFPLCKLSRWLPDEIEREVSREAAQGYIINQVTGRNVTIMGYRGSDMITKHIELHHGWESHLVTPLIRIMKALPKDHVTFLDVGSNIGVYTLQAADAGFPTVSVDANIRNLVRMRLAARRMRLDSDRFRLFWAFFHARVSIRYLDFNTVDCNVGGAGGSGSEDAAGFVTDTVPVMTAMGNDLLPHLSTPLIVMKIDIETSERVFFETGQRLMKEKNIVVVQMEWWRPNARRSASSSPNHRYLVDYFVSRNYVLLSPTTMERLDTESFIDWDTLWVRAELVEDLQKALN